MSYEDFQKMCEVLVTPIEIVEYLKWRLKFYENNRLEIQPFLERLGLTVQKAQNGEYEPTGSLRSILRKYVILFVSSGKIDKNLIVV